MFNFPLSLKILLVLLPITLSGLYFYNSYTGLESTVETQRNKITELESNLKLTREISAANLKKIKELEATIEVNSKSVSTLCTLNNEVTTRTNEVILNRKKKENAISRSYIDVTKRINAAGTEFFKKFDLAVNEDNELSASRIDSLWESYCDNKTCEVKDEATN